MNDRDELFRLKAAIREYDSPVDEARAFLQHLEGVIDNSLSSPMFTRSDKAELAEEKKADLEKEKTELERARSQLRLSFDELAKCFFDPLLEQKSSLREFGYYSLWGVMGAAFVAGSRGTLSIASRKATKTSEQGKSDRSKVRARRRAKLKEYLELNYPSPWPKSEQFVKKIIAGPRGGLDIRHRDADAKTGIGREGFGQRQAIEPGQREEVQAVGELEMAEIGADRRSRQVGLHLRVRKPKLA
jgi:hypothetical protein